MSFSISAFFGSIFGSIFGSKKAPKVELQFCPKGELTFHLNRFKQLNEEIFQDGFNVYHIVEIFWCITDLQAVLVKQPNMSYDQTELLNATYNWGRCQYGFNQAKDNEEVTSSNVFLGGQLGEDTGLIKRHALDNFNTLSVSVYGQSDYQEYLAEVYKPLFTEILKQFIELLEKVKEQASD